MKRLLIVGLYALLFVPADPFGIAIPSVGGGAMACEWDPDTLTLRCGPGSQKRTSVTIQVTPSARRRSTVGLLRWIDGKYAH